MKARIYLAVFSAEKVQFIVILNTALLIWGNNMDPVGPIRSLSRFNLDLVLYRE